MLARAVSSELFDEGGTQHHGPPLWPGMLEALAGAPLGVNELAQRFAVAQPTASNHLKLLREAGLVSNDAGLDRHKLVVDGRAVSELLGGLGKTVLPDQ